MEAGSYVEAVEAQIEAQPHAAISAAQEARQRRAEVARMHECRDLTKATLAHSQRVLAHGARLLAATAPRVLTRADDPGSRAAALGPSLARALMALSPQP